MDPNGRTRHYYFELLKDFTDFGERHRTSLMGFKSIDDHMAMTSCGHNLPLNQTYLIGAQNGEGNAPALTACTSWIETWHLIGDKSDAKIAEYKSHCGQKTTN